MNDAPASAERGRRLTSMKASNNLWKNAARSLGPRHSRNGTTDTYSPCERRNDSLEQFSIILVHSRTI